MDPLAPPPEFSAVFGLVTTVVILGIIGVIVVAIVNAKKAADLGHNPLTMQTELQAKVLDSQALAAERSVEERLAELERLRAAGLIDDAEYEQTRARILGSL
ncbi:SHOCT domain-containing protein [Protaetiibacter mangrovi]|uniref:SHOCT domain-containing protein n=1 Tax=Protaetiibacter mangrovi TaxID=2970926 RepID=A0ABT1ZID7_9MICO|nr:SHOCT domain-containing protein [Protaetiibacter mangrovi]MCS0500471.1 SHOCT domain-containing protein [Protaetiibacter mangrovi]